MIILYTVWLFLWLDWSVLRLPPFELSLLTFRGSNLGEYIPLDVSESGIGTRLSSSPTHTHPDHVSTLLFSSRIIAEVRRCIVHCTALKSRIMRPVSFGMHLLSQIIFEWEEWYFGMRRNECSGKKVENQWYSVLMLYRFSAFKRHS